MKLREFGLLTDQNIHGRVVSFLRGVGLDVVDVKEQGWHGWEDSVLLQRAVAESRLVVTHDGDFGALAIRRGQRVLGIVYLRPGHIDPPFTIDTIQTILTADPELVPPFLLVAKRQRNYVSVRIRRLGP